MVIVVAVFVVFAVVVLLLTAATSTDAAGGLFKLILHQSRSTVQSCIVVVSLLLFKHVDGTMHIGILGMR